MLTQKELSERQGGYIYAVPDPMPPTKIQGFMRQFPWIKKYVAGPIVRVYVSGIEASFLNYSPKYISEDWLFFFFFGTSDFPEEKIFLLDEGKELITVEIEKKRKMFLCFGPTITKMEKVIGVVRHGSSVNSIVEQLGEQADSIHFILSYYRYTRTVIIYKLPKGFSLRKWIGNETESERARFQKEIDAIT